MKVGRKSIILLNIFLVGTLVISVNGSVWNECYCQASPISCETPKVILESGTAGTSTIYTNSTSAKASVAAPRNWWNTDYEYHRQISIVNNVASTLGSGYSVCLTVNTTSLVSRGKMLSSGNDLRIVYWNGSSWIEIDRDTIDMNTGSTQVWFRTQAGISASGSDNSYFMYYGNPSAVNPPENKINVYDFWDDFDDASLDPAWSFSQIGGASGSYSESGTVVILNATTSGDLWSTSDNFLFLSISRSYDVLVESYTSGWGGSHHTWSKMGGVQLRQSVDANSKNRIMSPVYSAVGATNSYRLSTEDITDEQTTSTQPKYNRLSRIGGTSRAWYSTDGVSWTELGSQIPFSGGLSDPVLLGIHLAGISSSNHWVEVDWFKVRKYVDPEPSTSVGSEEPYSYYPTGYNILRGKRATGTVPDSVKTVDSDYFVVNSMPWWNSSYSYRRQITVANNIASPLDLGYSVNFMVDTASLVFAGKMRSDGNDLRVVYWNATSGDWLELDRDIIDMNSSSTRVWFETQVAIDASPATDNNYYVYYDNPSATSPPANKSNVYVWFDDFSTNTLANYDKAKWVDVHGGSTQYVLPTYDAVNERVWFDTGDNYASDMYPIGVIEAGFLMEVDFWANGSYPTDATVALVGRLENPGTSSTHYYLDFSHGSYDSPGITVDSWTNGERSNTVYSSPSDYYWGFNSVHTFRYAIFGTTHKFWWNNDISQPPNVTATDSLHTGAGRVGLVPAQVRGWWDNLKIRKYIEPEPSTSLGPETNPKHEVSTEFIYSGMTTNLPTQLNFTVVSHYNISNVNVTIQVWNYSSSTYVTSGEGYLTYTSTGANITEILNITTNPQFYTSRGYAKIRVTGINSTIAQFQQKINQIKLTYEYETFSTYDHVLRVVNQVADNWAVNLQVYNSSNIGRLLSLNINLHDGTSSNQIAVSGGNITQSEGLPYILAGNATIYISMSNLQATTTDTSYLYIYLKIQVPDISTYSLYVIAFEIT